MCLIYKLSIGRDVEVCGIELLFIECKQSNFIIVGHSKHAQLLFFCHGTINHINSSSVTTEINFVLPSSS